MKQRSLTPIGVELDSRWVHAVQLARAGAGWRPTATAEYRRTPDTPLAAEAERLHGVLQRRGFEGARVVLASPPERTLTAVLELPPRSSRAPIDQLAAAELARLHKADPAALEVALWEVPTPRRSGAGCDYLVAACPHAAANDTIDAFESAGLTVTALDLPQLALTRAFSAGLREAPSMDAIVYVGWDHCTVLVLVDAIVAYERRLEGAEGRALVEPAARRAAVSSETIEDLLCAESPPPPQHPLAPEVRDASTAHAAAIVEQVQQSFAYISRRYPDRDLGSVFLAGRFARIEGLAQRLAGLHLKVRTAAAEWPVQSGTQLVAAGLALHEEGAPA